MALSLGKKDEGRLKRVFVQPRLSPAIYREEKTKRTSFPIEITRRIKRRVRYILYLLIVLTILTFIGTILKDKIIYLANFFPLQKESQNIPALIAPFNQGLVIQDLERKLHEKNLSVERIHSDDSLLFTAVLKDGPTIIFSANKDIDWQISSLESILLRLTLESRKPTKVDFRYEKPLVNF